METTKEEKPLAVPAPVVETAAPEVEVKPLYDDEPGHFSKFLLSVGVEGAPAKVLLFLTLTVVLFSAFVSFLSLPPFSFPKDKLIVVKSGAMLSDVSLLLNKENIIRSQSVFEFCAKVTGGDKPIVAGQYLFKDAISSCAVAYRISHGISGIPAVRITIPEGVSNKEIADILTPMLTKFDGAFFLDHARSKEGYLFPDTYLFSEGATTQDVENTMSTNFNKKIDPFLGEIEASKHSKGDVVIMASILEREATTEEDKAIVSGILWNRISKGMALQVDAPFLYLLGKKSSQLTSADLQMNSAYNTYRNKGLPAGPIGNPGLAAIRAAIHPTATAYTYYLSDKDGVMHYAKTYAEFLSNKAKYLK